MGGKIAIIEDEAGIADAIAYALKTDGFEPLRAATGQEGIALALQSAVALVILDVGLPDTDGFSVARAIRKERDVPIIFLTARNDEIDRVVGLELGADDYVTKPFSPRELTARVKAVLRRTGDVRAELKTAASSSSPESGPFLVDEERFEIRYNGTRLDLSVYEFKILKVFLRSPGRVFTREHLMALCWEDPDMSLERTVDAHIKNIRQKLRSIGVAQEAIVTHRGLGYSFLENFS